MKNTLLLATLIVIVLVATAWGSQQSSSVTWEYKIEYQIREKKANELGAQGWELVAIGSAGSGPTSNITEYVFKRRK